MPSHGIFKGAVHIPTSGSSRASGTDRGSREQKRSASSNTVSPRFSGHFEDADTRHPASAICIVEEGTTTTPPTVQLPSRSAQRDQLPLPTPPEPAPGGAKVCNRPWRKRAREARCDTVIHKTEEDRSECLGKGCCGDTTEECAWKKEEVVESRKDLANLNLPIVDLAVFVFPLVVIVVISMVQNVP